MRLTFSYDAFFDLAKPQLQSKYCVVENYFCDALKNAVNQGYIIEIHRNLDCETNSKQTRVSQNNLSKEILDFLEKLAIADEHVQVTTKPIDFVGIAIDNVIALPDEFTFKFAGPFQNNGFDIIVPFYNEQGNVSFTHQQLQKLERLLKINNYIYIQNGSIDRTSEELQELALDYDKIKIVEIEKNQGYGYGMGKGIQESEADFVITNHADCQFDAHAFLVTHMPELCKFATLDAVFPKRVNRPIGTTLRTKILQIIMGVVVGIREIKDFNGQPKILRRKCLPPSFPKNFCFDLEVYLSFQKNELTKVNLPIIEKERHSGTSSWATGLLAQVTVIQGYLSYALKKRADKIFRKS